MSSAGSDALGDPHGRRLGAGMPADPRQVRQVGQGSRAVRCALCRGCPAEAVRVRCARRETAGNARQTHENAPILRLIASGIHLPTLTGNAPNSRHFEGFALQGSQGRQGGGSGVTFPPTGEGSKNGGVPSYADCARAQVARAGVTPSAQDARRTHGEPRRAHRRHGVRLCPAHGRRPPENGRLCPDCGIIPYILIFCKQPPVFV